MKMTLLQYEKRLNKHYREVSHIYMILVGRMSTSTICSQSAQIPFLMHN